MSSTIKTFIVTSVLVTVAAAACAQSPTSAPASEFQRLNDSQLSQALNQYGMTELLGALADQTAATGNDVDRLAVAVTNLQAQASRPGTEPARREELFNTIQSIMDRMVDLTSKESEAAKQAAAAANATNVQKSAAYKARVRYFQAAMNRAIFQGSTRTDAYVANIEYLLDSPSDRKAVQQHTDAALKSIEQLVSEMNETHGDWERIDDPRIAEFVPHGASCFDALEAIQRELSYRQAWVMVYRGLALPKDDKGRSGAFEEAISKVVDFANVAEDEAGVKFEALFLMGLSQRELGKLNEAKDTFARVLADGPAGLKLRCLFNSARVAIDAGSEAEGDAAVKDFRLKATKLDGISAVWVDMQGALLESHLYEVQAGKTSDRAKAGELRNKSAAPLLKFMNDHPAEAGAFMQRLSTKYKDADPTSLPVPIQVAIGINLLNEGTPEGRAKGEKVLDAVIKPNLRTPTSGPSTAPAPAAGVIDAVAQASGMLGGSLFRQGRLLEAAIRFRQFAQSFPTHREASKMAFAAVGCLAERIESDKANEAERNEYLLDLEVLVFNFTATDVDARNMAYKLGVEYMRISRTDDAIKAFELVDRQAFLPARYQAIILRGEKLLETPPTDANQKTKAANDLIGQAKNYHDRAKDFAPAADLAEAVKAAQLSEVQSYGANVDMLAARVALDVLDQPAAAESIATQAEKDWTQVPSIAERVLVIRIQIALKQGDLAKATDLIGRLKGAEQQALVIELVRQVRDKIERLDVSLDKDEIVKLVKIYQQFAEMMYEGGKKANNGDEAKMYPYTQALAGAYEYSADNNIVKKGLDAYLELNKANAEDATNIRGIARCYRKLGDTNKALDHYNKLTNGLPKQSGPWWRAQREKFQYASEVFAQRPNDLRTLLLQFKLLYEMDNKMGGYLEDFIRVRTGIERIVGG